MEDILNEIEVEEIKKFVANKTQFEAVRKVLLKGIYFNGVIKPGEKHLPNMNFALSLAYAKSEVSNEELGADLRACAEGIRTVETGFSRLVEIGETKVAPKVVDKRNKAR